MSPSTSEQRQIRYISSLHAQLRGPWLSLLNYHTDIRVGMIFSHNLQQESKYICLPKNVKMAYYNTCTYLKIICRDSIYASRVLFKGRSQQNPFL